MNKKINQLLLILTVVCLSISALVACTPSQCELGNHSWSNGELTTPATYNTDGNITYTCLQCKETKTEIVSAGTEIVTRADLEDAIVSVAWAYYAKEKKAQYDSLSLTKVGLNSGGISRHSKDLGPEYGTSDSSVYKVCSAFVCDCYLFGIDHRVFEGIYGPHGAITSSLWTYAENQPQNGYVPSNADSSQKISEEDVDTAILRWVDYDSYLKTESESQRKTYDNMCVMESSAFTDWYTDGKLELKKEKNQNSYKYYLDGKETSFNTVKQLASEYVTKQVDGEFINLRPGDIIDYESHAVIYIGNGYCLDASDPGKYNLYNGTDVIEPRGTVYGRMNTVEYFFTQTKSFYTLIRPLDYYAQDFDGNLSNDIVQYDGEPSTVPESSKTRIENPVMDIDRTVSVKPYGTVTKGEEFTYSVKITNRTNEAHYNLWLTNSEHGAEKNYQDIKIIEKVPLGTEFISASEGYTIENGVITWEVDVPAGETIEVTYTVKATADIGSIIVNDGGFVGGIPSNSLSTTVGNKKLVNTQLLTDLFDEEDKTDWATTFGTDTNFANNIYRAMGVELNLPSVDNIVKNVFKPTLFNGFPAFSCFAAPSTAQRTMFTLQKTVSPEYQSVKNMLINGYYGGYRVYATDVEKLKQVGLENFDFAKELNKTIIEFRYNYLQVGDIIVYATSKNRGDTDLTSEMSSVKVMLYAGDGKLISMERTASGNAKPNSYSGNVANAQLTKAYWNEYDIFFALRPSQAMDLTNGN